MKKRRIYLDHASLSPLDKEVAKEMAVYSSEVYANPSSIHAEGVKAKAVLQKSRKMCAEFLHALPDEIIFTAGGTEANNLAIEGLLHAKLLQGLDFKDLHMVLSTFEHPSVMECANWLAKWGVEVEYAKVTREGIVDLEDLRSKIRPNTFLVSIMCVNNEIGTIQPIAEIGKVIRRHNVEAPPSANLKTLFHVDACQAGLYLELNTLTLGADLLTLDGQKMNGPRGVGLLYKKRGVEISPVLHGGSQEEGLRPGTENVAGIAGLAKALELASARREKDSFSVSNLRDYFISEMERVIFPRVPGATLNGSRTSRIANNVNVSFPGIDNEFLVLELDAAGIAASTKSSCLRDEDESYVVRALGGAPEAARSSIRFSLGRKTSKSDIDYVIKILAKYITKPERF